MARHLEREMEALKRRSLAMTALVEDAVRNAVAALSRRDAVLAQTVIEGDREIDAVEVEVEEECLKLLALHQPVANDLRFVVVVLKMNDELERIGDLAQSIAERSLALSGRPVVVCPYDYKTMADRAVWMLTGSIDALVHWDGDLARQVWFADEEVDALHRGMYDCVKAAIRETPQHLDSLVDFMTISRLLERIADHAKSIAKDVLYMIEGEIVRHRRRELRAAGSGPGN